MFAILGCMLIIIGTSIGAGMLALPLASGQVGLPLAALCLIAVWLLMTITGLQVHRCASSLPADRNSFNSMALRYLGRPGQWTAWISCLLLLYALTGAYISGDASLLSLASNTFFKHSIPTPVAGILFVLIFGGLVTWSTKTVDLANRGLMLLKFIALFTVFYLVVPIIHLPYLKVAPTSGHSHLIPLMIPIFLTAFGYHTVVPSLCSYLGAKQERVKYAIVLGTTIPLLCYLLWLACTLGIMPQTGLLSYQYLAQHGNHLELFIQSVILIVHNPKLHLAFTIFSDIAVTTSFLGVTLGLFDFLADAFKRQNHRIGRIQTSAITFIPPLVFSWIYPNGFMMALRYAAIFITILEIILPGLMVISMNRSKGQHQSNITSIVTVCIGILLLFLEIYLLF